MAFGKRPVQVQAQAFAPRGAIAASVAAPAALPFAAQPAPPQAPPYPASALRRIPVVTPFLLVLLTMVFIVELRAAPHIGATPTLGGLIALGAVDRSLVFGAGEWWRVLTAPLLHASPSHLIGNAVVFGIIGYMLEPLIGPRWFAGLFAVGAVGGSLGTMALDPPNITCVGASGAIMGVLGAAFICGSSAKAGPKGRKMQTWALRMILPSLIPFAADSHVDYAGHLGGVLTGIAAGVVMQMAWTRGEDRPHFGSAMAGLAGLMLAAALAAFAIAARPAHVTAVAAASNAPGLMPDAVVTDKASLDSDRAAELVARYPRDPRAHLYRGIAFITAGRDLADAEEQFRTALDPAAIAAAGLSEDFRKTATVLLAISVAYQGRPEEARRLGAPLCDYAAQALEDYYDTMTKAGICGG